MSVFKGEKVGLVGPNGAGKPTIFRLITKEEQPNSSSIMIEKNVMMGYFSQDVGEMSGRSALEETMAGAPPAPIHDERIRGARDGWWPSGPPPL